MHVKRFVGFLSVGALAVVLACATGAPPVHTLKNHRECEDLQSPTAIAEFHDCQRFVEVKSNGKLRYNQLVGIVSTALDQATIWNFDNNTYDPLWIRKKLNCLYIRSATAAKMVSRSNATACPTAWDTTLGGSDLLVEFRSSASTLPTARWGWDGSVQFIVMACETPASGGGMVPGSCEIGPAGGWSNDGFAYPAPANGDRQVLGEKKGNSIEPITFAATIYPVADLANKVETDFYDTWVLASRVVLDGNHAEYESKMGFRKGWAGTEDQILLCAGTPRSCPGVQANVPQDKMDQCTNNPDPATNRAWWVQILSKRGATVNTKYLCITRRAHPGVTIPGAARWLWSKKDEGFWMRCGNGCCSLEDF